MGQELTNGSRHGLHSEERLRLYDDLFSGDLFGLYRANLAGRMLNCNLALAKLLGYASVDELLEIPVEQHYFDVAGRHGFLEDLLEKKQLNNYEVLLRHRTGRAVHVLENTVLREEPGRVSVIEGVVIDITALRESELEQRVLANNYRQLTEQIRDGLIVVQNGKVAYSNPAADELLPHRPLIGATFLGLVADKDAQAAKDALQHMGQGSGPAPVQLLFKAAGDETRALWVQGTPTWHMNADALQLTLQDKEAERRNMRESLRADLAEEMNAGLREEIENHKRTHQALEHSRRLAKSLIDSSLDMIIAVDRKGTITEFNPAASIKFGYEAEEVVGKKSSVLYADEEEFIRVKEELDRYGAYAGEVRNITREGKTFVSFLAASRVMDEEGRILGSMGVSRDVTQAKRDREALRESEERYRDLVDNANDMIHTVDQQGKFLFVNEAWKKALGYKDKDLATMTFYDLMADDTEQGKATQWMAGNYQVKAKSGWKATFKAKDGRRLICEGTSTVKEENGVVTMARSIFRDITEKQEAEEKIRHHHAKEKALFESGDHMFWTVDRKYRLTNFNKVYHDMIVRLHGKPPKLQDSGDEPKHYFAPMDYHDFWRAKYDEAFSGKKVRFETNRTDTDGKDVWNEIFLSPIFNERGDVEEVFGLGNEVTAEREVEAKAREQAAKLHSIFEGSTNMMIWTMDRERMITSCNRNFIMAAKGIFGGDVNVGSSLRDSFLPFISDEDDREYQKVVTAVFGGKHCSHELQLRHPTMGSMWIEIFSSPITTDGEVREASFLAHDITEKKNSEKAILDSLREKEVLLKEVHHRVKNNLQIISSIFNLQQGHMDGDERSRALLRESQNRIRSMAFIHESLYQNKNFTQVDLAGYIKELCSNLAMSYALHGRVRMETDLQPLMLDLDKAIPCGLVLNELISNALKHAFPDGREGVVAITLREDGPAVKISLTDNGAGFPEDYQEERNRGLGMELVEILMAQLEGNATRTKAVEGTSYLITFERS
ncbi:MAG TPA: PAS domain S-box protein [Flavobacteriales bacterium]|nr:PAS domain S-box protein [Flavobacteriales bacterium]